MIKPLFHSAQHIADMHLFAYPDLNAFLLEYDALEQWHHTHDFLCYVARNKSVETFKRFRTESERFLLWCIVSKTAFFETKKDDILKYAEFCNAPPRDWVASSNCPRFISVDNMFINNPEWRPFTSRTSDTYTRSQQSILASFTALSALYKHMMIEGATASNPVLAARRDCPSLINDAQIKPVKRLTELQWSYVLDAARQSSPRDLFLIVCLKVLFLRISELSARPTWVPRMRDFWGDNNGAWWLKVYGKGRKIRDVSVPDSMLEALLTYRHTLGLMGLPNEHDATPIIASERTGRAMTTRHLSRLVDAVFLRAYVKMVEECGRCDAKELLGASTHWLRHTGASMEIERGRPLKDLSDDLGHASITTTDSVYIQSESFKRSKSGRDRQL